MEKVTLGKLNDNFSINDKSSHQHKREVFDLLSMLIDKKMLDKRIARRWLQEQLGRKNTLYNIKYYKSAGINLPIKREINYLKKTQSIRYIMGNLDYSDLIMILLNYEKPELVFDAIGIESILEEYDWVECYYAFKNNDAIDKESANIFLSRIIIYLYDHNDKPRFEDLLHEMEEYTGLSLSEFNKVMEYCRH